MDNLAPPGCIKTVGGRWINPLDPDPAQIDPIDIAHSLSLINRYTGHTFVPYSVAQHSCYVCDLVSEENKKYALLHDASEYVLSDVARPVKYSEPMSLYRRAESHLTAVILERFGLSPNLPDEVKWADDILLYTEMRDLMNHHPNGNQVLPDVIEPWNSWQTSKLEFIQRLVAVGIDIEEAVLV